MSSTFQFKNQDVSEIEKFDHIAHRWWDAESEFKPLHQINPLRLEWISRIAEIRNKKIIDIGCGGGLLSEGLARKEAVVTGIDLSPNAIQVAQLHALESQVTINYEVASAEIFAQSHSESFDVICCLEMLEHVPDPQSILSACAHLLKPCGWLFVSTFNRNAHSFLQAIIGAEYLLKILPKGTHDWEKFITPAQMAQWLREESFQIMQMTGMGYNPLTKKYSLSPDTKVNYMMACQKL